MSISTHDQVTTEGFGDLLRRLRLVAGLSQEALAAQAGLSARAISDLERGVKSRPHPETIRRLADALGLPLSGRMGLVNAARPAARSEELRAAGVGHGELPVSPSPLIGRARDTVEATRQITDSAVRLLTLTGPGGVGKTRLAVEVADRLRDRFADGVVFVALGSLTDAALVPGAVARGLGVGEASQQALPEALRAHLREKRLLLVLDNFEHLLAAATLVAELLDACPGLTVIATSREPLRLRAEQEFPVPPLAVPQATDRTTVEELPHYGAAELFVLRVRAVRPDFAPSAADAVAVAEICRNLDGLPLALELAAAWCGLLLPHELLERSDARLPLLEKGARDLPDRQRTMRHCIAWSHDLLPAEEQTLFRRLAVFAGGFTLEAAEALSADLGRPADRPAAPFASRGPFPVLEGLASLVEKNLVRREGQAGGIPRFGMLETIREFGLERLEALDELADAREAHGAYFLALAERAEEELRGQHQADWLDRLEADHNNVRAALGWAEERSRAEEALRIASSLWRFWTGRGHRHEGRAWLERALGIADGATEGPRAKALYRLATFAIDRGDFDEARRRAEECLAIRQRLEDRRGVADALDVLGIVAFGEDDYTRARHFHEDALAIRRQEGNRRDLALSLYNLADVTREEGDISRAIGLYHESLAVWKSIGDVSTTAYISLAVGIAYRLTGNPRIAEEHAERALAHFREIEDGHGVRSSMVELARIAHGRGDREQAERQIRTVLTQIHGTNAEPDMAHDWIESIEALAWLHVDRGTTAPAAKLLAAAAAARTSLVLPFPSRADREAHERALAHAEAAGGEAWASAWREGLRWTREDAVDAALEAIANGSPA